GAGEGIIQTPTVGGITANFFPLAFGPTAGIAALTQVNSFNLTPSNTRIDPSLNYPLSFGLAGIGGTGPAVALPALVPGVEMATQWAGTLNVVTAGTYTFTLAINATGYVVIDNVPVIFGI